MQKISSLLFISTLLLLLTACSKDNNNIGTTSLVGDWKFMGIQAETYSSATDTEGGTVFTDVTTSEYTTTNNSGTVNISGSTMSGSGIGYSANMNMFVTEYENHVITDTFSMSLPITIPPVNTQATFEFVGADSIHYTGGSAGFTASGGPASNGAKFTVSGNTLTLTSNVAVDKIIDTLGTTITQHETAKVVATLQRQ